MILFVYVPDKAAHFGILGFIQGFKPGPWEHSDHIEQLQEKKNLVVLNGDFK